MITNKEIDLMERTLLLSTEMKSHQTDERYIAGRRNGIEALAKVLKDLCGKAEAKE